LRISIRDATDALERPSRHVSGHERRAGHDVIAAVAAAAAALGTSTPALPLKPCTLQGFVVARCGRLAVREDRRRPSGRKIKLFVAVVPSWGPKPHRAPIFYLSGGPGGAAASGDAAFAVRWLKAANRSRDLVLVDQRGVGKSAPLACPTVPQTIDEARACLREVRRDPRLYTTDAAMDDLDAVRRSLHDRQIVLYGGSYGASAAQVYIARHGSHVAAAVLDGASLLDVPLFERMPLATQRSFDRLAARCAGDASCRPAFPDVGQDLRTVLARLRVAPVHDGTFSFDAAAAEGTIRRALLVPSASARLPLALHRAAAGDYRDLLDAWEASIAGARASAGQLMYWAIVCGEGWARTDEAEVRHWATGTSFLEDMLDQAVAFEAVCPLLGEPIPAPDTGVVPKSRVPVLFLVGGMDPQDPLENVEAAPASLPNARILVVPGAGHGALQYGCVPTVAARFLTSHRLTDADRACASAVREPTFALP
jgi:pimeloyl-ACP methyl ester carboxylesterase